MSTHSAECLSVPSPIHLFDLDDLGITHDAYLQHIKSLLGLEHAIFNQSTDFFQVNTPNFWFLICLERATLVPRRRGFSWHLFSTHGPDESPEQGDVLIFNHRWRFQPGHGVIHSREAASPTSITGDDVLFLLKLNKVEEESIMDR